MKNAMAFLLMLIFRFGRYTYFPMNKKLLNSMFLGLMMLGSTGKLLAQAHCAAAMSQTKPCCCCATSDKASHCPMPTKKTDCPMFSEGASSSVALTLIKFSPQVQIVSFGIIKIDAPVPVLSFEKENQSFHSFRTDHLHKIVPLLRAPPALPVMPA
jgi:hypothetical protein